MSVERGGAFGPQAFYNGFSLRPRVGVRGAGSGSSTRARPVSARLAAGLVVLVSLGVLLGYAETRLSPSMNLRSVARPPLPAAVTPTPAQPTPPAPAQSFELPPPPDLPPLRQAQPEAAPAQATRPSLASGARPAFHCDWALSRSEAMVCGDPELSRLDRQLNHAFYLAVRAGVPRRPLRAAQDRWERLRDRTARRGPHAVGALYRERIAQLDAMAARHADAPHRRRAHFRYRADSRMLRAGR